MWRWVDCLLRHTETKPSYESNGRNIYISLLWGITNANNKQQSSYGFYDCSCNTYLPFKIATTYYLHTYKSKSKYLMRLRDIFSTNIQYIRTT